MAQGQVYTNLLLTLILWINSLINLSFLGPKLPYCLRESAMVTSPAGNGVILIGGASYHYYNKFKIMLELKAKTPCTSSSDSRSTMAWVELSQKLSSIGHISPIAIAIPDDLSP